MPRFDAFVGGNPAADLTEDTAAFAMIDDAGDNAQATMGALKAELASQFGLVANAATGVAATDTAYLQTLLATGRDVRLRRTATAYAINDTLELAGDQELDGDYAQVNFSHAGALIGTTTPATRSYYQQVRRLSIVGPGIGVAGSVAIDMDSISLARVEEVSIQDCATGVKAWSAISGGCVYNTIGVNVTNCAIGVDIGSSSNENRVVEGSKIGGCTTAGVRITDANRCTAVGVAFEVNAVGVDLVGSSADLCILNNVLDSRFESNTIGVRVGALVKDTRILINGFTGSGTFLEDRGISTVCDDRRVANGRIPTLARRPCIYFDGTTGNYAQTPDVAALDITGDIDIRFLIAAADWTPGTAMNVVDKLAAGQHAYRMYVQTSGKIGLIWSADGTNLIVKESTVSPTIADGAWLHCRAVLDVDNGAAGNTVSFFTSQDGATWDALGTPVVTASTTSIFASTTPLRVGVANDGASGPYIGRIAYAEVRQGIAGTVVARFDAEAQLGATRARDTTGKVWTMTGSAWATTLY